MMRTAHRHERITTTPGVMGGKACVKGTRIPVEIVLSHLGAGETISTILDAMPGLAVADVHACAAFAADIVADEAVLLAEA